MNSEQQAFFMRLAGLPAGGMPHAWQGQLVAERTLTNRLIRIPTGMGKTFGVLGAWAWNRLVLGDSAWPRRLVWCLPMRVLVEQVAAEITAALQRQSGAAAQVPVIALMGGLQAADWQAWPESEAVLVGTQDMLLSRALNRGYGAARARWPMEFGLLNHDCLWVMDEVQLMDVGLATSAQLQAFRDDDATKQLRPCKTWWMSATLQPDWLSIGPDTVALNAALPEASRVPTEHRSGLLWDGVHKPVAVSTEASAKQVAALAAEQHVASGLGTDGPTLIVLNRVARAVEVFDALARRVAKEPALQTCELRLVHSRFRPAERTGWRESFLNRVACAPGTNRIVVTTQVVEAGVDISAALLLTDLAPWPSLVQRFGRAARWGGRARVIVIDARPRDDKAAAPYAVQEVDAAREALHCLDDVSPRSLEAFEESHQELLGALYPYRPLHLLLREEVDDLFDTAPDLCGADIDISRFIRSGDERDVQVCWRSVPPNAAPEAEQRPAREELCAVPFLAARDWLCAKDKESLKPDRRAWVWDWLDARWRLLQRRDIYPGQTLLVDAAAGGYDLLRGFDAQSRRPVLPLSPAAVCAADLADEAESDESLSVTAQWQTIAFHGWQVGRLAREIGQALAPELADLLDLAGRWHDAGKGHPAFQASLQPHLHGAEIAKAPGDQWQPRSRLYRLADGSVRAGFRHELASTLALFALLRRCRPDHPALLGPWRELLVLAGQAHAMPPAGSALADGTLSPLEREVLALDAEQFDLLVYLVCAHHGKVRMSWQASPADQSIIDDALRIRGVRDGDVLPSLRLAAADGERYRLPAAELVLAPASVGLNPHTGRGWTERVLGLLKHHGPFALAWLEALIRAADQRASRDASLIDPDLEIPDNAEHGLRGNHPPLEGAAGGREAPAPLDQHPAQRGAQHGGGGRAGGSGHAGSRARPPAHATRYLETQLGTLSCLELAPHLALAARRVEAEIESGGFDKQALDEHLIAELHQRLCAELTPHWVGWRTRDVQVGAHTPPAPHLVPLLMREYGRDLGARLDAARDATDLIDALAFAEGRLLSIHPFADFNGRASRLFLRLLMRRLDLPDVELIPDPDRPESYFETLRADDRRDWQPLRELWRQRIEQAARP